MAETVAEETDAAVTVYATAVEQAIDLLGTYPTQEQIAQVLEGHGFFTPAGYHNIAEDHQGASNSFAGQMVYDDDLGAARLEDVNTYAATETAPPPGVTGERLAFAGAPDTRSRVSSALVQTLGVQFGFILFDDRAQDSPSWGFWMS